MSVAGAVMGLVVASVLPNTEAFQWRDFIAGFDPYKDEETLHLEETARLGFVQLNSGSTSFNTTLNLTGPILLGLGIATATLFYAYFNAFNGAAGAASGGYGTYRAKRDNSLNSLDQLDNSINSLDQLDNSINSLDQLDNTINSLDQAETPLVWLESVHHQLTSSACQNLLVCHANKDSKDIKDTNKGKFIMNAMARMNQLEELDKQDSRMEGLRIAMVEGKEGKDCFSIYHKCHLSLMDVEKVVGTLGMEKRGME